MLPLRHVPLGRLLQAKQIRALIKGGKDVIDLEKASLIGLAVFLGFIWKRNLDTDATRNHSRDYFYHVLLWV
jgi:hypothetical protein